MLAIGADVHKRRCTLVEQLKSGQLRSLPTMMSRIQYHAIINNLLPDVQGVLHLIHTGVELPPRDRVEQVSEVTCRGVIRVGATGARQQQWGVIVGRPCSDGACAERRANIRHRVEWLVAACPNVTQRLRIHAKASAPVRSFLLQHPPRSDQLGEHRCQFGHLARPLLFQHLQDGEPVSTTSYAPPLRGVRCLPRVLLEGLAHILTVS